MNKFKEFLMFQKFYAAFIIVLFLMIGNLAFAQGKLYEGPDDPAGDSDAIRDGYMNGNRIQLYFNNKTQLSDWPRVDASIWPNNYEGVRYLDGIALLVGARVFVEQDSIPVDDTDIIKTKTDLDTIYYCQTAYMQLMDQDPTGKIDWGFYPVHGYFNKLNEYPAMSNREDSWPLGGWPSIGAETHWPGEWDGRFGRGVKYADLETYFVVNDAQDLENLGPEDRIKYYPRPGYQIGYRDPNVSIQKGKPWGGLGLRVEVRGFQWNNPQARDAIFWEYSIANISDYNLTEVGFGYWVDTWIGYDPAPDDVGYFDTKADMAYCWDNDGIGYGGRTTGTIGFAYLESPGLAYDNIDNDGDGLIDEKRDNIALTKVGPYDGIANLKNFLDFYKLREEDLKEHWDADEDQDWEDGIDANGNGVYDPGEFAGDDLGLDGVGPGELNYNGPDEGECNHKPDFEWGKGCEPNFAETDVSESDMIGLTSFRLFKKPAENSTYHNPNGDESMWEFLGQQIRMEYSGPIANLILVFASGPFPLYEGRVERISMSLLHSYDPLNGLISSEHSAPALFEQKRIVQVIYEKDYRFAQPPKMPTLNATAGDGVVYLTWDDIADTRTRDPFVGNVNDFEGYKLFRSSDKKMSDAQVITDGYGTKSGLKPIFQCDKVDSISGFAEFGNINGSLYYLGRETGIVHHFIDSTVQNGRTYYYALVAYDYGYEKMGIAPSENSIVIDLDESEDVRFIGQNVQIVTPHQKAAGYIAPQIDIEQNQNLLGSGTVIPSIIAEGDLKTGNTYKITFRTDEIFSVKDYDHGLLYTTNGFSVYNVTEGNKLVYEEGPDKGVYGNVVYNDTLDAYHLNNQKKFSTDVFEGLRLELSQPFIQANIDILKTGWVKGNAPLKLVKTKYETYYFPWEYDVIFRPAAYTTKTTNFLRVRDDDPRGRPVGLLNGLTFDFEVVNKMFIDSTGNFEKLDLIAQDRNNDGQFSLADDRVLVGPLSSKGTWAGTVFILDFTEGAINNNFPVEGDRYSVSYIRPFFKTDSILFTVKEGKNIETFLVKDEMNKIKVVPNPYVATNSMEPEVRNQFLNQRRRIMFTNVPAQCAIKIYTVSGVLVDELQVENSAENGIIHWDLLSREGLEVAAGIYLYHIKSNVTGDEKIGKFAIIK
jgi:hypothetical protein